MNTSERRREILDSTSVVERHVPTILLIDDDPEVTQTIEMRLDNYQVNVIRRFTGMQGIGEANIEKPDLVVTDLMMPQGDGEDLLTCLKGNVAIAHVPVIVLTGMDSPDLPGRMIKKGAVAFFRKPVQYAELLKEIAKHVELKEHDRSS